MAEGLFTLQSAQLPKVNQQTHTTQVQETYIRSISKANTTQVLAVLINNAFTCRANTFTLLISKLESYVGVRGRVWCKSSRYNSLLIARGRKLKCKQRELLHFLNSE